jgi:hypothetical protein
MRASLAIAAVLAAAAGAFALGYQTGHRAGPPALPPRSVTTEPEAPLEGIARDLREVLLEPDALVRVSELGRLFQELGPEDLEDVRRAYDSAVLDLGDVDLVLLAEWWARFDPEGAYEWTGQDWRADEPAVILMVLRAWARSNPEKALSRAHAIASPQLRNVALDAALAGWDESGKPGLLEYVEAMQEPWDRQRMVYAIARRKVLRDGAEAAFRWAEDLPESSRLYAFQRVAAAAAESEPRVAAAFAERHAGGDVGTGLYQRVGTRWAERDPEAAMRWLAGLPESPERTDAVGETYRGWLRRDPKGGRAWLEAQPPEPWLDAAISIHAKSLAVEDPRTGCEWALRIADENVRWPTAVVVARWWLLSEDEAAARAWIEQAEFPPLYHRKVYEFPRGLLRKFGRVGSPPPAPPAPDSAPPDAPAAPPS